jgi:Brp/Blh family beta-carotene 15,15'-monooxygenase
MNSALRAQGLAFCGLAAAVSVACMLLPPLTDGVELLLISGLILALGVPHGALDTVFARQVYQLQSVRAWLLAAMLYGGLMALVVWTWVMSPTGFLVGFLVLSIAHFAGDLEPGVRTSSRILYAGAVLVLPSLRFESDVARLFGFLAGPTSGVSLAAALSALAWPWLACCAAAAVIETRQHWRAGVEILAVVVLALCASPLVGFAVFFCGMHSLRHVIRTYQYADRASLVLLAGAAAVPMLIVLLATAAVWLFLDQSTLSRGVTQLLFVGLAALTVPHMVLVERVRLSGWRLGAATL